ncbi:MULTISPECIES: YhjD/YihY/BrkB family envelope integrity protein [unclassified Luteococcus]|uniref:YhjD/YihY/BrkB family envelope integrity protein n=1 Tax=unclassified Luteococcus TaxID=2639923 RepID=UPI00313CAE1B
MGLWRWLKRTAWSAHLIRANDRFQNRMGNQLAGGITYFSVLTLVPALMFAFSFLGWILTVVRRSWLDQLSQRAIQEVGAVAGGPQAIHLIMQALNNWRTVLLLGIASAAYSGSGWMGNLRGAVRAQWRPEFDMSPPGRNWLAERFVNLLYFLALIGALAVSFTIVTLAGNFADQVLVWLDIEQSAGISRTLKFGAMLLTVGLSSLLFWFLFHVLPQYQAPLKDLLKGSFGAGVAMTMLLYGTTQLISWFSRSLSTVVFGNIIIVMLFFNAFARLILFAAAWIATSYQPAIPRKYSEVDLPLRRRSDVMTVPGHWEAAEAARLSDEKARQREKLAKEEAKRLESEHKRHRRLFKF